MVNWRCCPVLKTSTVYYFMFSFRKRIGTGSSRNPAGQASSRRGSLSCNRLKYRGHLCVCIAANRATPVFLTQELVRRKQTPYMLRSRNCQLSGFHIGTGSTGWLLGSNTIGIKTRDGSSSTLPPPPDTLRYRDRLSPQGMLA